MIAAPTTTSCQKGWTASMTRPFWRTVGMNAPTALPSTVPTPPKRLVPPMTTAPIAPRLSVWCETDVVFVKIAGFLAGVAAVLDLAIFTNTTSVSHQTDNLGEE